MEIKSWAIYNPGFTTLALTAPLWSGAQGLLVVTSITVSWELVVCKQHTSQVLLHDKEFWKVRSRSKKIQLISLQYPAYIKMYPFEILPGLLIGKFCLTQKCVDVLSVLYWYHIMLSLHTEW